MKDPTSNAALIEKYDAVPYEGQSNALSHPDTMAAVARLHGLEPPPIARCRVLEVGCSEGANLLPMAATLPEAMFVGCDLSPRAIDAASRAVADLALSNVILQRADLRELPATLGEFDYIIAHGVYSWVPAPVRDALFDLASRCLSRNGLMFVSYNTYPGCHVRRAAWEIMHLHIDAIEGAAARLDAARVLCKALGEPAMTQIDSDAALRGEFLRLARQSDSALCHDDLAQPNDPVYFRDFVAHAERHGLQFLAEAKLSMMSGAGVAPGIRRLLAGHGPAVARAVSRFRAPASVPLEPFVPRAHRSRLRAASRSARKPAGVRQQRCRSGRRRGKACPTYRGKLAGDPGPQPSRGR